MKALSVNPLKVAPGLGAAFAAQGFFKAVPFFHSAPGCSFLSKVLLTQHFKEPIASGGSDIKETALVFGDSQELESAIEKFCQKSAPEMVFILSSSVPEIRGETYDSCLASLKKKFPDTAFIVVHSPDFEGGFSEGFAKLVYAAIDSIAEGGEKTANQINLLPAPYMTAADIDELAEILANLGLSPVIIPDLSCGPDGSKEKFSAMSVEGTSLANLKAAGKSSATVSFGRAIKQSGDLLQEKFGIPHFSFESAYGLTATDTWLKKIIQFFNLFDTKQGQINGTKFAQKLSKERARLKDIMIDAHAILFDKNVATALEYDQVISFSNLFSELGIKNQSAFVPIRPHTSQETVVEEGSLYDIERAIKSGESFDALISNSHADELSQNHAIPLIRAGFPVNDRYGYNYFASVGYRGGIRLVSELANVFLSHGHQSLKTEPKKDTAEEKLSQSAYIGEDQ